jgi:hypothetical protein
LTPEYPAFENPLFVPAPQVPVGIAIPASALILMLGLLTGAGSLVGRFRRARGVECQQLRDPLVAAAAAAPRGLKTI